jgi:hypothetical protein
MTTSTTNPSVKDRLQEMLLATDKFDPSTGELMARWADAFYTTMAARTGMSAQDLYKRFPLRVRSQDAMARPVMAGSPAEVKPSRADRKMNRAMEAAWQGSVSQQLPPVKNVMARSRNAHLLTQEQRLYEWREVKIAAKNLPSSKRQHEMHKDKLSDLRNEGWLMSHVTQQAPLLFAWDEDGYHLVDGAHRLAVAQEQNDTVTVLIGRPRSSQTSSERVTDTPEFKRWFGRSQVVDGLGRPLVLYHGTGADFGEFRTDSELGAHFGTAVQAEMRMPEYSKARWGGRLVPVYLSIKNPLRLRDLGNFHPQTVAAQLIDKGIKPKSGQGFKLTSVTAGEVRAAIEEHGYDGVVYLNRTEGISPSVLDAIETEVLDGMFDDEALDLLPGAQDSYIAFRPEQIKSAIGNDGSFDRDDSNILSQPPLEAPPFQDWFKDSKVVDRDGNPLVVYHGTTNDFTEFNTRRRGAFFSSSPEGASAYSGGDIGANVVPAYLSITNPYMGHVGHRGPEISEVIAAAKRAGHDGAFVTYDDFPGETAYVAFRPEQIKSAIGNDGSFDRDDSNILSQPPLDSKPANRQTRTPEFKTWFADSKIVTRRGMPKRMHHGTDAVGITQFRTPTYFTASTADAQNWGENVVSAYLSIKNPIYIDDYEAFSDIDEPSARAFAAEGYDGAVHTTGTGAIHMAVAFHAEQIGAALDNDGSFDRDDPSILSQSALEDSPAARSPLGLYSALAHHLARSPTRQATPAGWKQLIYGLINKGAIKAEEVEWSGINDWLDLQQGKVSKEQVAQYLELGGVRVEDTVLGGFDRGWRLTPEDGGPGMVYDEGNLAELEMDRAEFGGTVTEIRIPKDGDTKYSQYTLPGGTNYREVLLTLPSKEPATVTRFQVFTDRGELAQTLRSREKAESIADGLDGYTVREVQLPGSDNPNSGLYRSSHWGQPNVLAHIRVNDRTDADGNRVLFVEELQSDWGQEGKKKGFIGGKVKGYQVQFNGRPVMTYETRQEADAHVERAKGFDKEAPVSVVEVETTRHSVNERAEGKVLNAPFVTKTEGWLNLALKRVIVMAAEGGYDRVAFVNGAQCVERFRLSHRISELKWRRTPDGIQLHLSRCAPQGLGVLEDAGLHKATDLAGIVGKEIAQAIVSSDERSGEFTGLDLRVGGEGLRTFYDEVVPLTLKRLLNRLDPQSIGPVQFPGRLQIEERLLGFVIVDPQTKMYFRGGDSGRPWVEYPNNAKHFSSHTTARRCADAVDSPMGVNPSQPGFTLTPLLREKALQGLPLFQRQVQAKDATPRGTFDPRTLEIALGPKADASTWIHETGHFFLEVLAELASQPNAPASIVRDMDQVLKWFGVQGSPHVERSARGDAPGQESSGSTLHQTAKVVAPAGAVRMHDAWSVYQEKSCRFGDAHVRWIEDGDTAYIIDLQAPRNTRGREVVRGLAQLTGRSIHAVGVVDDAAGFWDRMEEEGLISGQTDENFVDFFGLRYRQSAREDHEGRDGSKERPALPLPTQPPHRTALQTWMDMTLEQKRPFHEQWASAMEQYVMEGKAPSEELRPVMEVFSAWLRAIYASTRDFLDQAIGGLTNRAIRTSTRSSFGPSETLFRKALADQQAYTENPRAWFESRLHDVAQRLSALGVEAVMGGNGRPARFFSSDGEVPASALTGQAGPLATLYEQINSEYDAAETGRPPQFMPVGLDPDIELMPMTDRQRVVDLLTSGLRGELPVHAPLMQAPAAPDPGLCRLTLTDDIRCVMDRLLSEQALDSWASGDEEESAATDRRERMRA